MHELSIALSILDIANEQLHDHGDAEVLAIHLKLGRMSGVVKEALVSAFELAREGTKLEQAQLVIEDIPVMLHCRTCQCERPAESMQSLRCAVCGGLSAEITRGHELEVFAMELEPMEATP
ncbi:hydrogenase maturation nickel metallochaperone HypA [Roseiconus nitratireducens]|uniref:Hydrogenase maturation factor HypA n=1 Tax=Roseiconus nitratireducens TaxID=2605748 RepID=A0A5M6D856_9BACT|nr:hydrogenase maturation nickel metallochaperone HypA [Roseiconus nitratireducens]KAA5543707.1 hydrogenase maturation nickel metallochaperone HypA [Roseiconus nitratireducens]